MNHGRIVLITGAAGGMGALFVGRFLANGDTVIATDHSEAVLTKLADKFDESARLQTMAAGISDEASCAKLAAFARDKAGRVDVLINCAGFFPTQSFDEMSLADWNKVIGINLTGVFLMVKAVLPLMKGGAGVASSTSALARCSTAWRNRPITSPRKQACSVFRVAWREWLARRASPLTSSRPASRSRQLSPSRCRQR
jgi:NAD(P)-dependent dehydrogenase (short-subunit alcohol dehydrogenase family)